MTAIPTREFSAPLRFLAAAWRPLPALALARALGIVLADIGALRVEGAIVLGTAAAVAPLGTAGRVTWRFAALGLAMASGAVALGQQLQESRAARPAQRREAVVEATVAAVSTSASSTRVDLRGADAVAGGEPLPRRLRVYTDPTPPGVAPFVPGDRIRSRLRLRAPHSLRNPGGSDRVRPLERAGIGAVGRATHPALWVRLPEREGLRPLAPIHAARARTAAQLVAHGPGGPLLAALAVGDRSALDPDVREAFARVGLAHLLAVSGLHVGLVAALAFGLARVLLARHVALATRIDVRRPALLGAVAAAAAYALLAGWGVPVRRAMVLVAALAIGFARERPTLRAEPLAAAALLVLTVEPEALFLPGAQLSFAASAALVGAAARPPDAGAPRLPRVSAILRTSATALAVTAPLAAFQLGQTAPVALLANLVAVPWTALVLLPAALSAGLATATPANAALGIVAERLAAATVATVAWAADAFAAGAPPGAASGPGGWWAVVGAVSLVSLRVRRTRSRVAGALAVGALLSFAPHPSLGPPRPRVLVLDVGQGDSVLVQGRAASLLIDAGTALPGGVDLGRREVAPALRALGVGRLDWLVASHADLDHRGGLPAVLREIPVGELWLPFGGLGDPDFEALVAAAREQGVPVAERGLASVAVRRGDLEVTPLWPPRAIEGLSRNDRSLVLRVATGRGRILLPGDIEAAGESGLLASGADLSADVLKIGHHGSRTSSSRAFVRAVDPILAIATAPRAGRYPMPHPEVVERLRAAGASLWWTGRDGAVWIALGERAVAFGVAD